MPYSFTQIEKDKSATIGFVFLFLILFYFVVAVVLYVSFKYYFLVQDSDRYDALAQFSTSGAEITGVLIVALIVGGLHFLISIQGMVSKILAALRAKPLDSRDTYHIMFRNILDEVSVATGGRKFEGVVVATSALNAFAVSDFEGRAVIGVTEGLLARLNRAQLETVVGHEAAHILTGDCLETTVITSMFELYGAMLSSAQNFAEGSRGRAAGFFALGWVILHVSLGVSSLLKMFISRQRELRADAISVRLTRNPLSLAEALYTISRNWRGYGLPGDGLQAIYIVSPAFSQLEEEENFFSDLFATHPPIHSRISILLDMAHASMEQLEDKYKHQMPVKQPAPEDLVPTQAYDISHLNAGKPVSANWEVFHNGLWRGPFPMDQLMGLGWVEFDTYVRNIENGRTVRFFESEEIKKFNKQLHATGSALLCPLCRIGLNEEMYKGSPVSRCPHCLGALLTEDCVTKFLIRDDYFFSEKIRAVGDAIMEHHLKGRTQAIDLKTANLLLCPRCKDPKPQMLRNFYTVAYPIEIDRCVFCHSIWFDKNELDILQYLIGRTKASEL